MSDNETRIWRARDGFVGTEQGEYITREGIRGVVLQQVGTTVCHIYRVASVEVVPRDLDLTSKQGEP